MRPVYHVPGVQIHRVRDSTHEVGVLDAIDSAKSVHHVRRGDFPCSLDFREVSKGDMASSGDSSEAQASILPECPEYAPEVYGVCVHTSSLTQETPGVKPGESRYVS